MRGSKNLETFARENRRDTTKAEAVFWTAVRRKEFDGYKFYRQRSIWKYIVDFYCPELKLVVEIDGPIHEQPDNIVSDKIRDEVFAGKGLTVIRFKNEDIIDNLAECLEEIRKYSKEKETL